MFRSLSLVALLALTACGQAPYDPTDTRTPLPSSRIQGVVALSPMGCRTTLTRICRLGEELRFQVPTPNGRTWASKPFVVPASQDGTTDGATIPRAVWSLIGLPYHPLFVRPAILHDHYTYEENLVRPWRDTHRMFFYALREEGVDPIIAQVMFYAVYTLGGQWTEISPGDDCGPDCAQVTGPVARELLYYPPTLDTPDAAREIAAVYEALRTQPQSERRTLAPSSNAALLAQIEDIAEARNPANIPFMRRGIATLSTDQNSRIATDIAEGRARRIAMPSED